MMKTKIFAAAAALGILASCQQELQNSNYQEDLVPVSLTAFFDIETTKVSYVETSSGGIKLQPEWKIGDLVIGFDEASPTKKYTFNVAEIDDSGKATLTGTCPSNCKLHLIYLYGASTSSISAGSLTVNYANQAGTGSDNVYTMPAVMLADGNVEFCSGNFIFSNAGAVIGIKAVKGVPQNSTVSKITVNGQNLSSATISLDGSNKLKLTAKTKTGDSISTGTLAGVTVNDANGTLSKPVLIAVPDGANVNEISVTVSGVDEPYVYTPSSVVGLEKNQYAYVVSQQFKKLVQPYVTIGGIKWARQNLAISDSGNMKWKGNNSKAVKVPGTDDDVVVGDYFQWATYPGFCGNASDPDKGMLIYNSFTNSYCVSGGSTNNFDTKPVGDGRTYWFGSNNGDGTDYYTYYPYMGSTPSVSSSKNNAPKQILGGTWRYPSSSEFKSLYNATYWAWDSTDLGYYVFLPEDAGKSGGTIGSIGTLDKAKAQLFFPAAGQAKEHTINNIGNSTYYLSSETVQGSSGIRVYGMYMTSTNVKYQDGQTRRLGLLIRPVMTY